MGVWQYLISVSSTHISSAISNMGNDQLATLRSRLTEIQNLIGDEVLKRIDDKKEEEEG